MLLSFSKFSSVRYSKESALQHLLDGVKKHCDKKIKVPMFKIGSVG